MSHRIIASVGAVCCAVVLFTTPAAAQDTLSPPAVVVPSGRTAAQDAAAGMGRTMSNQDIADAIRRSGLSEEQVRSRLQQAGFDAKLADPFFAAESGGAAQQGGADTSFVSALQQIGVLSDASTQSSGDSSAGSSAGARELMASRAPHSLLFGKDVFSSGTTAFQPITSGPVDASYRLGVGDQLQLVLTGQVELAYRVDVRNDGTVVVPQIGQVTLAGLTMDAARSLLRQRASRVYGGISNGRINLDLTLSHIRSNVVFVLGEVERPGAYQVNALSTVFHAIARAGGPTEKGSFRSIEVRRGNQVIRRVDLYDYLLNGDSQNDIRTEQGDIIYVPLDRRSIRIRGAVRREGIFELRSGEGLRDLLRFAGGLLPTAAVDRLQIDRILPPERRRPGVDRVLIDVPLVPDSSVQDTLQLDDHDIVTVFRVGDLRRNSVSIRGEVMQPGTYEWKAGMTLGQLLSDAQGFMPWAMADRVKVIRPIQETGKHELFSIDARDSVSVRFPLKEFDDIEVLDGRQAYPSGTITISGAVNTPGTRSYMDGLTLKDAVDLANGFKEGAHSIDIARRHVGQSYSDTTSVIYHFSIDSGFGSSGPTADFHLQRGDIISVHESAGYRQTGTVLVSGLFSYPGTYAIPSDSERVRGIIARAGGALPTAYPPTFRLIRAGRVVPLDFRAIERGDRSDDILVAPGDQIRIGPDPGVVTIGGAVERQVAVPYHRDWSLSDYIDAAGGLTPTGDMPRVVVEYASGEVAHASKHLFWRSYPDVRPGSVITVPDKPEDKNGARWGQALTSTMQVVTTMTSLLIAYLAVKR